MQQLDQNTGSEGIRKEFVQKAFEAIISQASFGLMEAMAEISDLS